MSDESREPPTGSPASAGEGDLDAAVARYLPRLHAYVRLHMSSPLRAREASLDVVQSICREVLEEREKFVYQGEGQLVSWLLTSAMNKLRERARFMGRQKRDVRREMAVDDVDASVYASLMTPSRTAMQQEDIAALEKALQQLPDDYREVIVLARIVGLPHVEIANRMQRTEVATRNLLGRALARLAQEADG